MNAGASVLGNQVSPSIWLRTFWGTVSPGTLAIMVPTGLYPRNAENIATVGGVESNTLSRLETPRLASAELNETGRLTVRDSRTIEYDTSGGVK